MVWRLSHPGVAASAKEVAEACQVELLRKSRAFGTTPMVSKRLAIEFGVEGSEGPYLRALARNAFLVERADALVASLRGAGMRVLPLKGYAALRTLYDDDLGARQMADIDLLVGTSDFREVLAVAPELERIVLAPIAHRWGVEAKFIARSGPEDGRYALIEVHKRLLFPGRYKLDHDDVWQSADLSGLCPEHGLVYLAMHKAQHGFVNDSRDLVDAALMLHTLEIDTERLEQTILRWNAQRSWHVFSTLLTRVSPWVKVPAMSLPRLSALEQRRLARFLYDPFATGAVLNDDRGLAERTLSSFILADEPWREALALSALGGRLVLDRALTRYCPGSTSWAWLDGVPLPAA